MKETSPALEKGREEQPKVGLEVADARMPHLKVKRGGNVGPSPTTLQDASCDFSSCNLALSRPVARALLHMVCIAGQGGTGH